MQSNAYRSDGRKQTCVDHDLLTYRAGDGAERLSELDSTMAMNIEETTHTQPEHDSAGSGLELPDVSSNTITND